MANCHAPEAIPGMPDVIKEVFGDPIEVIAEDRIIDHYCLVQGFFRDRARFPRSILDENGKVKVSLFEDIRGLNTQLFIAFLGANNPGLPVVEVLATEALMPGMGLPNPDFAIHRPALLDFEYYEIKPNSNSSKSKGRAKLRKLQERLLGLPYVPGIRYNPDVTEPLFIERKGFIETDVSLHWFKVEPGLLAYEVCVEQKLRNPATSKVTKALIEASLALITVLSSEFAQPMPLPAL